MNDLFVLAFDHRANFAKQLLGFPYPRLTSAQRRKVTELKQIVFDGFCRAWRAAGRSKNLAVLIDEEFGSPLLREAKRLGITLAMPVEKSGQDVFNFEYGSRFGAHLLKIKPTFAKALVRYYVTRVQDNRRQRRRLARLSNFCRRNSLGFMLEILLTGGKPNLARLRQTMREMLQDGVSPTVWKLEGLTRLADWRRVRRLTPARLIVLGRGESRAMVTRWLRAARRSGVANGFAIGRTIFFDPLRAYLDKKIARQKAVAQIAKNYAHFIKMWKNA